jgi:hypothetical protein
LNESLRQLLGGFSLPEGSATFAPSVAQKLHSHRLTAVAVSFLPSTL